MGKRGHELHERILWAATDTFLEAGFERTSMDVVAARAETTKRTIYSRFESKEKLFLSVIEHFRGLMLDRLGDPNDYSTEPAEALTQFCARYLEILRYEPAIQMCRVSIAEAARFPQGAALHFDVVFKEAYSRISCFLQEKFELSETQGYKAARRLLGYLLYPNLLESLFGVGELKKSFDSEDAINDAILGTTREAVNDVIESLTIR